MFSYIFLLVHIVLGRMYSRYQIPGSCVSLSLTVLRLVVCSEKSSLCSFSSFFLVVGVEAMSFPAIYLFKLSADSFKESLNILRDIAKIRLSLLGSESIMMCSGVTDMEIGESFCYQYIDWQQL